jgi:hypothetical protein
VSFKHGLTGSPAALFELFAPPMWLPQGSHFKPTRKARRDARRQRLDNFTRALWRGLVGRKSPEEIAAFDKEHGVKSRQSQVRGRS